MKKAEEPKADPKDAAEAKTAGATELVELTPEQAEAFKEFLAADGKPSDAALRAVELEGELAEERRRHEATEAWAQECAVALTRLRAPVPQRQTTGG